MLVLFVVYVGFDLLEGFVVFGVFVVFVGFVVVIVFGARSALIVRSACSACSACSMSVSNETASPALQSLMEEDSSAKPAEVASEPETAASQIANLVKKIKAKVMSPEKMAPTQPEADGTVNEDVDTSNSQVAEETMSSTDWRWIIGLGAGFILLVLVIILRRRPKSFS